MRTEVSGPHDMNINTFLNHYHITENPFHDEEARHDSVFTRIETACFHPDFEKIMGDVQHPSSSIVFGERGTGKTAIRLQIEDQIARHDRDHPHERCFALAYDELNPVLDQFSRHAHVRKARGPQEMLDELRLVDHIDAMMSAVVPSIVDQLLGERRGERKMLDLGDQPARAARKQDATVKHDLMTLQMCYDRAADASSRTARLKRAIRFHALNVINIFRVLAVVFGVLGLAAAGYFLFTKPQEHIWLWYATIGLLALITIASAGRALWLGWKAHSLAKELVGQIRVIDRPLASYRHSLAALSSRDAIATSLPRTGDDDRRYAMFNRLLKALRPFGYQSMTVLVDRVDEPTVVNGVPERMRALVWPMLNNKFLQQDRVGVKLLLPIELRYELQRESAEFFRQARLDKQNMIERLSWSGAVLYDLCTARLNACRSPNVGEPMSLRDLFEERVSVQELIDALDQMQQPRDAFKFIYTVIQEHCSNVPDEQPEFKISKPVLDTVRKQQVERVSGMLRGVRAG